MARIEIASKKYGKKIVLFDDEDRERIMRYKWHINFIRGVFYVRASADYSVLMHRFILRLKFGDNTTVDHIDGNGLNNRKYNLRVVSDRVNRMNSSNSRNAKYAYKTRSGKYQVMITYKMRTIYLGTYPTEEEARRIALAKINEI